MKFARALTAAFLGSTLAVSAQAAAPAETVINFPLLHLPLPLPFFPKSDLHYDNTVGGKLKVSAGSGELAFGLLGELGVVSGSLVQKLDMSLGKDESITLSFDKAVNLTFWDVDDFNLTLGLIPDGTDKFSLAIDGGAAKIYDFSSHLPTSALVGKSFTFGYAGDNYFLDTVKFTAAVPEAGTLAQLGLGLGLMGAMLSRRRKQA